MIPAELQALLAARQQQSAPQNPLLEAIAQAMGQRTRGDMPALMQASLPQGIRPDDPRNYYPAITPESMATDIPPPPPGNDALDQYSMDQRMPPKMQSSEASMRDDDGIHDGETSYENKPGEDKAERMAADAVEGKGVKYPGRESQAERHSSRFTSEGDSLAYEEAQAAMEPDSDRENHPDPDNWEDNRAAFIKKYGMTPEEWMDNY